MIYNNKSEKGEGMKISSINNHSFGRLKLTARTQEDKDFRDKLLTNTSSRIFDELHVISGKTPVEIRFINQEHFSGISGLINGKAINANVCVDSIQDVYNCAECLKDVFLDKKTKDGITPKKYFA